MWSMSIGVFMNVCCSEYHKYGYKNHLIVNERLNKFVLGNNIKNHYSAIKHSTFISVHLFPVFISGENGILP